MTELNIMMSDLNIKMDFEDKLADIIEQIIDHIQDERINIKDKKFNLFDYIDKYLNELNIDIGDDIYLDELVDDVEAKINKRSALLKKNNDDDIVFKIDEEQRENDELKNVIKKYDILYKNAKKIDIDDIETPNGSYNDDNVMGSSWDNVLNRIDSIYKKM